MRGRGFFAFMACLLLTTHAGAAPPADLSSVTSPKEAYARGSKAWKAGDKEAAAYWFARADALDPSDVALGAALRAVRSTSLSPLAMALSDRANRADVKKDVKALADETRAKHESGAGRVTVTCADEQTCQAKIDGDAPPEGGWLSAGDHDVSWRCGNDTRNEKVSITAGGEAKVDAACPAPEPAPAPVPPAPKPVAPAPAPQPRAAPEPTAPRKGGLSPTWVWVGVGVTTVLGAATIWSGFDTRSKNDDFVNGGRRDTTLRDEGMSAQTRTNILAVGTGVAAVATLGLGLFAVDFGSHRELSLAPAPGGAKLGGRF